jgi:uncharacterized protein
VTPGNSDELLGGAGNSSPHGDAIATRVLVKGEPVPAPAGRADDFALQHGNDANTAPLASVPAGASAALPADTISPVPPAADKKAGAPKSGPGSKSSQNTATRPKPPQQDDAPRPPRPVYRSGSTPFGLFR